MFLGGMRKILSTTWGWLMWHFNGGNIDPWCLIMFMIINFRNFFLFQVEQRDVPGIDCAYLAMDTEEGVEVVWNEVQFSQRKNFKAQEEKIQLVFESLTQLEHPNIVKFHRYWTDTHNDKPRVIFITEYMSSGSLKQFLKRTKRNVKKLPLQAWKRWCTQILSALRWVQKLVCGKARRNETKQTWPMVFGRTEPNHRDTAIIPANIVETIQ